MARYIVTITPPTPNGDLHLGHLAGPFLAADIFTRRLRQRQHDALLLSYSDDYQSYLLRKSRETSRELHEIASTNAAAIVSSLASVDIIPDRFLRAMDNPYFLKEVNRYFDLLDDAGDVEARHASIPFCRSCGVHGYEGFGRARCNYCGSLSDASQCEACARAPEVDKMGAMRCVLCGGTMEDVPAHRLFWRIGRRYPALRARYRPIHHRPALAEYLETTLAQEHDAWPLTRPGEAAIPLARHPDQPIHTWFAGLAGYRATLAEYLDNRGGDELEEWWSPETTLVQFLGFDCTYSHAIAYASLLALEPGAPSSVYHFTNRFLKLDGEDFSTSRNHAIWIRDIAGAFPSDAIRLYTALYAPENETRNFGSADFRRWFKEEYEGRILTGSWRSPPVRSLRPNSEAAAAVTASILREWQQAGSIEEFSIARLGKLQMSIVDEATHAVPDQRDRLWLLFAELGQAIHPKLSAEIKNTILHRQPETSQWLKHLLLPPERDSTTYQGRLSQSR